MSTTSANPEVGLQIATGDIVTNYHDIAGPEADPRVPVLLLHGSGPGVSAMANWRLTIRDLRSRHRLLAPDLAGFGFSEVPEGIEFGREVWLRQVVDFLDALGVAKVHVIGNSFGGSMALALAISHPERVERMVLMGAVGVPFEITEGLDEVWGFTPSEEAMGRLMRETFAHDASLITDELVRMRHEASLRPASRAAYESMFPAPRQRWVDAMAHPEEDIRAIPHPTLLVHGRDDRVIPPQTTLTMLEWIEDSRAHLFGRCGHWTQIEHAEAFAELVRDFFGGRGD
ncbi:alpha/beta fold hydrolase [Janibacter corallicola]|uniref:alpha/beta fold hydrolase n=1 Tax=Janibacter corallicola TaxID=415212 RepID=UPI0008304E0E|nr:alpha/beta fold hydrolase [Janibacter corallicola]